MLRSGFQCLAAVDLNSETIATLRENLQSKFLPGLSPIGFALHADLRTLSPATLGAIIGKQNVEFVDRTFANTIAPFYHIMREAIGLRLNETNIDN